MTIKKIFSLLLAFCVMFCMISFDTTPAYADEATQETEITLYAGVPAPTTSLLTPGAYYAANINTTTFVKDENSLTTKAITISQAYNVSEKDISQSLVDFYTSSGGAFATSPTALEILKPAYNHTSSAAFIYSVDRDGVNGVFDGCGGILVYDNGWYYSCTRGGNRNIQANIYTQSSAAAITVTEGSINVTKKPNMKEVYFGGDTAYTHTVSKDDISVFVRGIVTTDYTLTSTAISASNRSFEVRIYNFEKDKYVKKLIHYDYYVNLPTGAGFTATQTSDDGSTTGFAFTVETLNGYKTAVVELDGSELTPTSTSGAIASYEITYSGDTDPTITIDCEKKYVPPVTPVYPINKTEPTNGTYTVDKLFPTASDKVTITPTPKEDYTISGVTVTTKSGDVVPVTTNPDGTYSFVSPREAVIIEVNFVPEETELDKVTKRFSGSTLIVKSSKTKLWGKKAIKLSWKIKDASGAIIDVDGVEVYRAVAPYKNYKLRCVAKRGFYKNNHLNLNKKYRYKVRGYVMVDDQKVFTNWSNITVNGYK